MMFNLYMFPTEFLETTFRAPFFLIYHYVCSKRVKPIDKTKQMFRNDLNIFVIHQWYSSKVTNNSTQTAELNLFICVSMNLSKHILLNAQVCAGSARLFSYSRLFMLSIPYTNLTQKTIDLITNISYTVRVTC